MQAENPQLWLGDPVQNFFRRCYLEHKGDFRGEVASYIPELTKADPADFGICLATPDGHLFEIGDTDRPFTIQSISKPFVYGQALQEVGAERVAGKVGVEPSGDAFNSISLRADDGRPFNPMINAGAITCAGLVEQAGGEEAFEHMMQVLSAYAGRRLGFDESVYQSESETGDRNRAIAFMLKNHGILDGNVLDVLDLYFRMCSVLVTCRDLAVMAATLANGGTNPLTGTTVLQDSYVQHVLSVMATCGMYNFAGEWIYEVGMPAKSGVGGGILAALPGKLGVGVYSPALDAQGNSVRGVKVCKDLSRFMGLHFLKAEPNITAALHAQYTIKKVSSRRQRNPREQEVLTTYGAEVQVLELKGHLTFATTEFVIRQVFKRIEESRIFVFDFRRIAYFDEASISIFVQMLECLCQAGRTFVLSNLPLRPILSNRMTMALKLLKGTEFAVFDELDEALEWAENEIISLYSEPVVGDAFIPLVNNALCEGLTEEELHYLSTVVRERLYKRGARIIRQGESADRVFFIARGEVKQINDRGLQLLTLLSGMSFGEMALLDGPPRAAHVFANTDTVCWELKVDDLPTTEQKGGRIRAVFTSNLCRILAYRLQVVNAKNDVLSADSVVHLNPSPVGNTDKKSMVRVSF